MGETAGKMKQFATWLPRRTGGAKLRRPFTMRAPGDVLEQVELFFAAKRANRIAARRWKRETGRVSRMVR